MMNRSTPSSNCKVHQASRGYPVRKDCRENRVLLALLGVTELMVAMVLLAWAALLVLLALLVSTVGRAHRGPPGPKAPLARRVPPGYRAHPGSRAHRASPERWVTPVPRANREQWEHPAWRDFPEWQEPRDPRAGPDTTSK